MQIEDDSKWGPCQALAPAVFVIGKGGVGKSTVAAGLAVAAVAETGSAVLVEFGEGPSPARILTSAPASLKHVVIRLEDAVEQAATPLFGSRLLARIVLSNFAIRPLLRVAPAIRELAVLELVRQVVADNPGHRVVVDLPATGHGLAWLRVPEKGRKLFQRGPLYELCERISRELLCPEHASVVVVTLPERLVLRETLELCQALASDVGLRPARLIINRLPFVLAGQALLDAQTLAGKGGPLGQAAAELAGVLAARRQVVNEVVGTLRETMSDGAGNVVLLPQAPADPSPETVATWLREKGAA